MNLFQKLSASSTSDYKLQEFISKNIIEILDYPNLPFKVVEKEKNEINKYITEKGSLLRILDYKNQNNKSFILALYDLCERFGFLNTIRINQIIVQNNIIVNSRLKAGNLYLINVTSPSDLIFRFDEICGYLDYALTNEEDNEIKVNLTFANYTLYLVNNVQSNFVDQFARKLTEAVRSNKYLFLNTSDFLKSISKLNLLQDEIVIDLYLIIDNYISSVFKISTYLPSFLIEIDTEYSYLLKDTDLNFNLIRQLSVDKYNTVKNDSIYYSLQRGVKVLTEENQLFAYMFSFGNMHYQKLISGFNYLPKDFFENNINIIDWGCGQAMATMTYLEFLKKSNLNQNINKITAIEPSMLSLKRGSLHIRKFLPEVDISTINKDLDSLASSDFASEIEIPNLHLFSNILDIELFSLSKLIKNIEINFKGINYFICVSPYVTDEKTTRLDNFMNHFSKNEGFYKYALINEKTGQWTGNWTRVIRVFKVNIN